MEGKEMRNREIINSGIIEAFVKMSESANWLEHS